MTLGSEEQPKESQTMSAAKLRKQLHMIVLRYGREEVERCLQEMKSPYDLQDNPGHLEEEKTSPGHRTKTKFARKKRSKMTAPEYVSKMQLPPEKAPMVSMLADKFDRKSFLPTLADIRYFCQLHDIDEPASGARAGAIPRVFKFLAGMKVDDIRSILDRDMFSGPSRLGPIADAIRDGAERRAVPVASSPIRESVSSSPSAVAEDGEQQHVTLHP